VVDVGRAVGEDAGIRLFLLGAAASASLLALYSRVEAPWFALGFIALVPWLFALDRAASLLEAAGSAVRPVWITVECEGCGKRSRVEAPVPDVRARVAAIELLLSQGLGRVATSEQPPVARMPASVEAVKEMSWDDMQHLFAAIYVDELAELQRADGGEKLMRERVEALSKSERRRLREALAEPELV